MSKYKVGNVFLCWGCYSKCLVGCVFFKDGKSYRAIIDEEMVKTLAETFLKGAVGVNPVKRFVKSLYSPNPLGEAEWNALSANMVNLTQLGKLQPVAIVDELNFDYNKFLNALTGKKKHESICSK